MPRKFVISPTKLRLYRQCPAQYRLEYIDKIGKFYHRARAGYSFGHSLHRALDFFHNAGGTETIAVEDLTASLNQVWVNKGFENTEQETQFREEAVRILQDYHAAAVQQATTAAPDAPPPPHLLYTEKTLRMNLSPDVVLSGRIDRVDEHADGSLEIVDYKSGRETVSEEDVRKALAMGIYQLLLKHLHPDRRVFATIVALRSGVSASVELTDEERNHLHADCLETGEEIRTRDWENVLPVLNDHCPYCDFLPYCTRFWQKQKRHQGN